MKKLLYTTLLLIALCTFTAVQAQQKTFYFTTSDSVNIFVRIAGSGQPCLFIHGGPGSWTKYFYALGGNISEKDMTMIYVDQRGCGRSEGNPDTDYSLARIVKDYEELRTYLGYKQWLLMPHSFGGTIATEYAFSHPKQITGLIYVNTTLNLTYAKQSYITQGSRILGIPTEEFLKPGISTTEAWGHVIRELNTKDLMYQMMYSSKEGFLQMNAVMDTTLNWQFGSKVWNYPEYEQDFTKKTAKIKVPVLVFSGAYDYAVGTEHYKAFKFPKATYKVLRTGHCPYQEQPETFQQHIQTFLAGLKPTSRRL
jgi:proline iminopeptidase